MKNKEAENSRMKPQLARQLTAWFRENQRRLPWRNTGDPYAVWISEIMLQQTRVEAVIEKYNAFMTALPTIADLASCDSDRLMKLWEGLGYYSRARNLQKCAQIVMQQYSGRLPSDADLLQKLPGIGPYTAGAIASLAFGRPEPAVDGNVLRVLARLWGITEDIRQPEVRQQMETEIRRFLQADSPVLVSQNQQFVPEFNQGLMELGALVCVPNGKPHCDACPWQKSCLAAQQQRTDQIPFRSSLKPRRIQERTLLIIRDGQRFLFRRRAKKGLLAGLYEFPGIEGKLNKSQAAQAAEALGVTALHVTALPDAKHVFTHLEWHMSAYEIKVADLGNTVVKDAILVTKKELAEFAVPSAFATYIEYYSLRD